MISKYFSVRPCFSSLRQVSMMSPSHSISALEKFRFFDQSQFSMISFDMAPADRDRKLSVQNRGVGRRLQVFTTVKVILVELLLLQKQKIVCTKRSKGKIQDPPLSDNTLPQSKSIFFVGKLTADVFCTSLWHSGVTSRRMNDDARGRGEEGGGKIDQMDW